MASSLPGMGGGANTVLWENNSSAAMSSFSVRGLDMWTDQGHAVRNPSLEKSWLTSQDSGAFAKIRLQQDWGPHWQLSQSLMSCFFFFFSFSFSLSLFIYLFIYFCCSPGRREFLVQGSNPHHSSVNAGSFTCCAMSELHKRLFLSWKCSEDTALVYFKHLCIPHPNLTLIHGRDWRLVSCLKWSGMKGKLKTLGCPVHSSFSFIQYYFCHWYVLSSLGGNAAFGWNNFSLKG